MVFEADGIRDEAGGKGFFEGAELGAGEPGGGDFHFETAEVKSTRGGLGANADGESFRGEASRGEILRDILTHAAAEGGEEKFCRRHALVGRAVFHGLVEDDAVVTGFCGEARASVVIQRDFQNKLLVCGLGCKRRAIVMKSPKQREPGKKAQVTAGRCARRHVCIGV